MSNAHVVCSVKLLYNLFYKRIKTEAIHELDQNNLESYFDTASKSR